MGKKLTAKQARRVFASKRATKDIAKYYGIGENTVYDIKARRTWAEATTQVRVMKARKSKTGIRYLYLEKDGQYQVSVKGVFLGRFDQKKLAMRALEVYLERQGIEVPPTPPLTAQELTRPQRRPPRAS